MDERFPKIEALIWDMGGVLLRTDDPEPRTQLAHKYGMTRFELEDLVFNGSTGYQAQAGQVCEAIHWKHVMEQLGLELEHANDFLEKFFAGDRLDYRMVEYIRTLKATHRIGLLSNAFLSTRRVVSELYRIMDAFHVSIFSAEVGLSKPDPQIYHLALQRIGVNASQAVFIDDLEANIEAACRIGLHVVHFINPEQTRLALKAFINSTQ